MVTQLFRRSGRTNPLKPTDLTLRFRITVLNFERRQGRSLVVTDLETGPAPRSVLGRRIQRHQSTQNFEPFLNWWDSLFPLEIVLQWNHKLVSIQRVGSTLFVFSLSLGSV